MIVTNELIRKFVIEFTHDEIATILHGGTIRKEHIFVDDMPAELKIYCSDPVDFSKYSKDSE